MVCCDTVRFGMVSANALLSFDPYVTRLSGCWTRDLYRGCNVLFGLLPLLYTRNGTLPLYVMWVSLEYVSLDLLRYCSSLTVSVDASLSFDPYVTRLRLLPLPYIRRCAAAACGSRLSTSRWIYCDTVRSRTVSADVRRSFLVAGREVEPLWN